MLNQGYIKIYRKFKDWEWYTNINVKTLFLHCLIRANHKAVKYQGIEIDRGEFMTSIRTLSIETGLSERQVRTALDKLILTNELTSKSNNKYRIIKVIKYNEYQEVDKQESKQVTNKRQASDKPLTTNKNDKNEENDKNDKKVYMEFVRLTESEYSKLIEKFGEKGTKDKIENLNNYIGSKGKKYKSHYHTILNWSKKDAKDTTPTESAKSKAIKENLFGGTKYAN